MLCSELDHRGSIHTCGKSFDNCKNVTKQSLGAHPRVCDGAYGKKLICGCAFSFWLSCTWCRVVDGEEKSCMSWVLKWDFAKSFWAQAALCQHQ